MVRYDAQQVNMLSRGREAELLEYVGHLPREVLDGKHHPCPNPHCKSAKDGFRFSRSKGFCICASCFDKKNGDVLAAIMHFRGIDFPTALAETAYRLGVEPMNGQEVDPLARLAEVKRCPVDSLRAFGGQSNPAKRSVSFPMYNLGFPSGEPEQCSTFTVWPDSDDPKFAKGLNQKDRPSGMFLPHNEAGQVLFPEPGDKWLVCEGVKDASALHAMGFNVIGLPGKSIKSEWLPLFRAVDVTNCLDNDAPGQEATTKAVAALRTVARSVKVVSLPSPGDVRDNIAAAGQDAVKAAIENAADASGQEDDNGGFELKIHTSAELDDGDFTIKWFLENCFAVGQDALLAGGIKVLKTTIAVALAISIATGIPFLGIIRVLTTAPVLVLSGESGLSVLQETARRICLSLGISLRGIGNLYWSDCLPRFDNPEHIAKLTESLEIIRGGLLIVDPAYLALPGDDAGNVFAQGEMLRGISILCRQADVTLLLLHHFSKTRTSCEIPELQDIAWSGFGEFARQWLLLARREKYVPGTGEHKLWLSVGGSVGHSQMLAVDINEGLRTDAGGRRWDVVASSADEARQDAKRQRELDRAEKLATQDADDCRRVLEGIRQFSEGETKSGIRDLVPIESKRVGKSLVTLLKEMRIEQCEITKNGRRETGYRATKN